MKKQLVFVAVIILILAAMGVYALMHPGGLSIQSSWSSNNVLGSGNLHYEGTIFNHEEKTANSVRLELWLYDSRNFIIKTETIDVGDIPAQSSKNVSLDVPYSSFEGVSRVESHLIWNP